MNQDLKIIKKKYGEKMAHLCRELFPTILETDGLLLNLMLSHFEPNHDLYDDIISQKKEDDFKDFIYNLIDIEKNNKIKVIKTPKELLSEAGYDLYECKTEEDIQNFKKYYAPGETLCTFKGGRLSRCHVFFAIKKNVDEIKREDYPNSQRQDEYGTSVISIQFTKDESHTLSIKNRYNHHVNNPDSTFGNSLDSIIDGLTESFAEFYGLEQKHPNSKLDLNGYVLASDGKLYKYSLEVNNVYYCPNNIIIDNFEVKRFDKEKYIVFEYFILDLVKKEVKVYDADIKDSFPSTLVNIPKIEVKRKGEEKEIKFTFQDDKEVKMVLDKDNKLIELDNPIVKNIGDNFLIYNENLKILYLPAAEKIGDDFLSYNLSLVKFDLSSVEEIGDNFLYYNKKIYKLAMPRARIIGNFCLYHNETIKELDLPELAEVGNDFLTNAYALIEVKLLKLQLVGNNFLYRAFSLKRLYLPSTKKVGNDFLRTSVSLKEVDLSSLEEVGDNFMFSYRVFFDKNLSSFKIGNGNFNSLLKENINQDKNTR